jgi:transcriptional regulator with GAF, ATPase, and Fis domain
MFFLKRFSNKFGKRIDTLSQATMDLLLGYRWPGNIRELQNVIERAVILSQGSVLVIDASQLRAEIPEIIYNPSNGVGNHSAANAARGLARLACSSPNSLEEVERRHILTVLQKTQGLIEGPNGAARILAVNPSTLRGRVKKLGIKINR